MLQTHRDCEEFSSISSDPRFLGNRFDPHLLEVFHHQLAFQQQSMLDMPPQELMARFSKSHGIDGGAVKLLHDLQAYQRPEFKYSVPFGMPPFGMTSSQPDFPSLKDKGEKKKRRSSPKHLSCHVCGDRAPNHCHYGGIACFSCRAFFRRSVPKYDTYTCSSSSNCVVTPATRKNCQKCRFDKCVEAGMKASWVLSDEEKLERLEKKRSRKGQSTVSMDSSGSSSPVSSYTPPSSQYDQMSESSEGQSRPASQESFGGPQESRILSYHEERCIEQWVGDLQTTRTTVEMSPQLLDQIVRLTHTHETIDTDTIVEFFKTVYCRIVKFVGEVDGFSTLSDTDKKTLLSKNMDMLSTIQLASSLHPNGQGNLEAQFLYTGHYSEISHLRGHHGIAMEQIFVEPWAKGDTHKKYFSSTIRQLAKLLREDTKVSTLFQLVALFHTENVELDNKGTIESVQEGMATLLHKYLKQRYGQQLANSTFSKLMASLFDLRCLAEILTGDS
uniref:Nuclear receptor n=1 Tax=Tigriopus japonicus TaxID=158387 RepID=A0A0A7CIW8_TIGJA|nr:nuclear receptor [Tigriopus japonicus]